VHFGVAILGMSRTNTGCGDLSRFLRHFHRRMDTVSRGHPPIDLHLDAQRGFISIAGANGRQPGHTSTVTAAIPCASDQADLAALPVGLKKRSLSQMRMGAATKIDE
jgi:hypothetical protein